MLQKTGKTHTLTTGLAMFSMLFGAGNIVFPLALGQYAQDKNFFAILGLLITAVGVPFMGLIAMTLFEGDYRRFFDRIGKVPGFLIAVIILGLIGPFGAMPRCIALSYSTIKMYLPNVPLYVFSAVACSIIFLFAFRRTRILDLIGYVLTPVKLGSLVLLMILGILASPVSPAAAHNEMAIFLKGLQDGYQTMDLLGAFFFCSIVLVCLKKDIDTADAHNYKRILSLTMKASCIGALLLASIYIGFSYVAASYSGNLNNVQPDEMIAAIAVMVVGPYAGLVVCLTVSMACLTTAIALGTVFAEFLRKDVCHGKINYATSLVLTLIVSFLVSTLNFNGIANMLSPILQLCYPALIALSIVNILYKLFQFEPVKVPVLVVFGASVVAYFL